jgi:hypothetical protein
MSAQSLYVFASGLYLGLCWRQYPLEWSLSRKLQVSVYVAAFWPACLAFHIAGAVIDFFRNHP